jgi:hypothetical protein
MKNKLLYTCMTSLAILLASCQKLVTVNPQNSLTPEQTLVNVNGYLTLLTAVYNGVEGYGYWGRDIILEGDALSDNIVTNNSQSGNRYSTANVNSAGATFNIWQNNYFYINQLNTIIAGIGNRLRLKFWRSHTHFAVYFILIWQGFMVGNQIISRQVAPMPVLILALFYV